MIEEIFKETLRKNNLFRTRERVRLFRELAATHNPCSTTELIAKLSNGMDETTVYRNLELFEEIGIVNRIYNGWKYKVELSDKFHAHHHHMTCINCGTIISFEESDSFIQELKKLEQKHGFKSNSHSLELRGLCNSCY